MSAELISRVDAWLVSREEWVDHSAKRLFLASEWYRSVTLTPGARLAEAMSEVLEGVVALRTCILLALVREAWDDPCVYVMCDRGLTADGVVCQALAEAKLFLFRRPGTALPGFPMSDTRKVGQDELSTLVAALEAAP